ncbi:molecular chaperone-like protein [Methylorubrum zatmanii]|nr:molecular chaperone-like protein [Methylorubrum zatmanii]
MDRFRLIALLAVVLFAVTAVGALVIQMTSDTSITSRDTAGIPASPPCDPPEGRKSPPPPECPQVAPPTAGTP